MAQRREASIEDPAYVLSVPACGIAQAYLSACSHAASSQPHSLDVVLRHGPRPATFDICMTSTLVSTIPMKRLKWTSTGLAVPTRLQTLVKKNSTVRPCFSALFHTPSRHALSHVVQFPVSRRIHCMHRAQARASVPAIIVAPELV